MVVMAFGCDNNPDDPDNDDGNPNNNEDSGTQNGGSQNGGSTTENNKYSKYSQILRNVMEDTDGYYSNLISFAESASYDYAHNNPKYQTIPYGFLEDKNYDINKIKNKELYSCSELYSIDNDLFVELKVEVAASTNYLDCYLLKYTLTDQELSELKKLFTEQYSNPGMKTFYQAPFFIQELSYVKNAEVISLSHTTKTTDDGAIGNCDRRELLASGHNVLYLGSTYLNDPDIAYHTYQIKVKTFPASCNTELYTLVLATSTHGGLNINGVQVHDYINFSKNGTLTTENREKFESSKIDVTAYTTRSHLFTDIKEYNKFEAVFETN